MKTSAGRRRPSALAARDVGALVDAIETGDVPAFHFFWGHTGVVEKACFSQWYPAGLEIDGVRHATAEHWMMSAKARLFGDREAEERIAACGTPAEAKIVGREVRGFDDTRWNAARFEIVVRGNVAKFGQDAELGRVLRATDGSVLVEASPRDRIWGIGLGAANPRARIPREWRGQNLLGFALMEARERLGAR